jgi:phosphinothricin acetyltransferase
MSTTDAVPAVTMLRAATLDDAPPIAAIYAEHVLHGTASFELSPPTAEEMRQRMDALLRGGFPFIAACRDGELVGYAYAGPYRPRPAYRYTVEDSIYLAPGAQRQGIGSALLDRLIELCAARGDRQMIAAIGDSANAGSIAVHARAGFVEIGRLDKVGRKFERWLDVVFMQRALGDGAATAPVDRAP